MHMSPKHRTRAFVALGSLTFLMSNGAPAVAGSFAVQNLVSDGSVPAPVIDPNLINPWGISSSPNGPFWVANNNSGTSTLYTTTGAIVPLVVGIPGPANPTGTVFNGTASDFKVTSGGKTGSSVFVFATEGGTIAGWAPSVNFTQAVQAFDGSTMGLGAVYKGLAIGNSGGANFLYATDFRNGLIDQFNSSFNLVRSFTDPTVAAGYAPFGAQVFGSKLFVTYALQDAAKHDDVGGAGNGYVDIFNLDGTLSQRLVSLGGQVNSPWGLALAPSSFGKLANDLLVGNFGDGTISAFDPNSGIFAGKLSGSNGNPLVIQDLWGLINGNGGAGGTTDKIYFSAGLAGEAHGLFGSIAAVPEPLTWFEFLVGFGLMGALHRRNRRIAASGASFAK